MRTSQALVRSAPSRAAITLAYAGSSVAAERPSTRARRALASAARMVARCWPGGGSKQFWEGRTWVRLGPSPRAPSQ
jgi:hypothetical protein